MGFQRAIYKDTGRPGYDPRDLLKLYVYGYFNKIRDDLKKRKETYIGYIEELDKTGETQKLTTDPEARVMHSKDGLLFQINLYLYFQ